MLAERNGYPINWAAYARKMTHRGTGDLQHIGIDSSRGGELRRGGVPFIFETMECLRRRTPPEEWPKNEAPSESDDEEGREDDWNVNVKSTWTKGENGEYVPNPQYDMPAPPLQPFVSSKAPKGSGTFFVF